jgi:dihydrofolate synthase/folylpolyglutamate synthase
VHPRSIDLGLERVQAVLARLHRGAPAFGVITVGGTNGKGSTVAMLEAILRAAGYRTGLYTSPHLVRYNERVRIDAEPVSDDALCGAFERIEAARGDVPLTYFEFGTVAALDLMARAGIDVALLEVGMGGRLDAVNAVDADAAIVTAVDIDHTQWLGTTRAQIGREKAGIFRAGRPAICGDTDPPVTLVEYALAVGAPLYVRGRDYTARAEVGGWCWRMGEQFRSGLPFPALRGDYQLGNAANALAALELLRARFPVTQAHIRQGLVTVALPGRFQVLPGLPVCVFDVAHNPQAAHALAATLAQQGRFRRTLAVFGMLADKDISAVVQSFRNLVDHWYLATLNVPRGASAAQLAAALAAVGTAARADEFDDVRAAYAAAKRDATDADRIVVFGSFHTVGDILAAL